MDSENVPAIWDPPYTDEPYSLLRRLREEAPVRRVVVEGLSAWLVTRYEDARQALTDPRLSNSPQLAGEAARAVPWLRAGDTSAPTLDMLRRDPPDHTRLRRLVSGAFTRRHVDALRPRVERLAGELLAPLLPQGRADVIEDFALPLPLGVFADLLGVPADRPGVVRWFRAYAIRNDDDSSEFRLARIHLRQYFSELIETRGREMQGNAEGGSLLDGMIAAREEGERLNRQELLAMLFLLVDAGFETTANLIGNGVLALLRNPDELEALRASPTMIAGAVEELLRYEGPVKDLPAVRYTTEAVSIGNVMIPGGGEPVLISVAGANRDPMRFADPDRLDVTRRDPGHLTFGHGAHYCLGAQLARAEVEIALRVLIESCPDLALAVDPGQLTWRRSRVLRSLKHLPVTFRPTAFSPGD